MKKVVFEPKEQVLVRVQFGDKWAVFTPVEKEIADAGGQTLVDRVQKMYPSEQKITGISKVKMDA